MNMLSKMCEDANVLVHIGNEKYGKNVALELGGDKIILLDENQGDLERTLTIAHEFAHHLFGHLKEDCTLSTQQKEMEAVTFSAAMTALILFNKYNKEFERLELKL